MNTDFIVIKNQCQVKGPVTLWWQRRDELVIYVT